MFCLGPSYETPAEISAFRKMGADLVGMSTVPEIITAKHSGMKVIAISCVTNMAAGVLPQKLSHVEVIETANRVKETFGNLVKTVVGNSVAMHNTRFADFSNGVRLQNHE